MTTRDRIQTEQRPITVRWPYGSVHYPLRSGRHRAGAVLGEVERAEVWLLGAVALTAGLFLAIRWILNRLKAPV